MCSSDATGTKSFPCQLVCLQRHHIKDFAKFTTKTTLLNFRILKYYDCVYVHSANWPVSMVVFVRQVMPCLLIFVSEVLGVDKGEAPFSNAVRKPVGVDKGEAPFSNAVRKTCWG